MSTTNSAPKSYSAIQKTLHWLVAIIIIEQLVLGEYMTDAWRAFRRSADVSGFSSPIVLFHIWGGLSVLAFAAWRLYLRRARGVPAGPNDEPQLLKFAASTTHFVLYAVLFIVPITGALTYFYSVPYAGDIHEWSKPVVVAFVAAHVAGAFYQHFWLKSDVFKRMTNG